jgi:Xaa-Pro aminopeptidase
MTIPSPNRRTRRVSRLTGAAARPQLRKAGKQDLLLLADSENDGNLYYAMGFLVGDPLCYLELGGRKLLLVNDLEYGRARAEAQVDEVISLAPFEEQLRARGEAPRLWKMLALFLEEAGVRELEVPASLPLGHADKLREHGFKLTCRDDPFFPERMLKTAGELAAIEESQKAAESCMQFIIDAIRSSEIRKDLLYRGAEPLTAEWLRIEAQKLLLERGFLATHMIIAGGDQGCDPHSRGSGPLPAHASIVIDIFPRSLRTRYWGDLSRTVVRGRVSPALRKLHEDVLAAQELAMSLLRDGIDGRTVHQAVVDHFQARGDRTEERGGRKTGFIHSTGHGIGLDIHEPPKLGKLESPIRSGQVVTIEPGLYYPGTGAVRIEDLVVVTKDGCRNLTAFPKELEL